MLTGTPSYGNNATTQEVVTTTPDVVTITQELPTTTQVVPLTTSEVSTTTPEVPTTTPEISTTTPEVSTTTPEIPTTTPSPSNGPVTFEVSDGKNNSCLMMTMEAQFKYKDGNNSKVLNVTSAYTVDTKMSSCSQLTIASDSNHFTFIFKMEASNKTYDLNEVHAKVGKVEDKKGNLTIGEVALKASYVCDKGIEIDFSSANKLIMKKVQYQAFTMAGHKYSTATTCPSDFSPIIPIIVGSVLAGLVLLVVIAYILGRRKTRTGYEEI